MFFDEDETADHLIVHGIANTAVKKAMEAGGGDLNLDDSSKRLFGGMVTPLPNNVQKADSLVP